MAWIWACLVLPVLAAFLGPPALGPSFIRWAPGLGWYWGRVGDSVSIAS